MLESDHTAPRDDPKYNIARNSRGKRKSDAHHHGTDQSGQVPISNIQHTYQEEHTHTSGCGT